MIAAVQSGGRITDDLDQLLMNTSPSIRRASCSMCHKPFPAPSKASKASTAELEHTPVCPLLSMCLCTCPLQS